MDSSELNNLIGDVRQLVETIRDVRSRIENNRSTYGGSESRTRYGLIDPILEKLGWDVRDPDLVLSEHVISGGGRADYALMYADSPIAVVEAKNLSRSLDSDVTAQTLNYIADEQTIKYAIAANGDAWRMQIKGERNFVFDLKLTSGPEYETALLMLHMSRSVLAPVQPKHEVSATEKGAQLGGLDEVWVTLSGMVRNRGKREGTRTRIPTPKRMRFPGRTPTDISIWRDVWTNWASWLSEEIQDPARWESIDDTLPNRVGTLAKRIRSDTSGFRGIAYQLPNGWFIDTGIAGQRDMWLAIEYSSQHFGIDLDDVHVSF